MKNKLITKIIMIVVCLCTLLVSIVVPSFASLDIPNASNPSIFQHSLPSGTLNVGLADSLMYLDDSESYDSNIPYFNYAGAGNEIVSTFNRDGLTPLQGSLYKEFSRSMLYTEGVNVLANTGFDGLYNSFTTRYNLSGGYGNTVRLYGFTFDDVVLLNTSYSFVNIYGQLSEYLTNKENLTVSAHYEVKYYDKIARRYKTKSVDLPLSWSSSSQCYVFHFLPDVFEIDDSVIYFSNYSVSFFVTDGTTNDHLAFDVIEPRVETRLAVPRLQTYIDYLDEINQDFYYDGINSIEEGNFNFFSSIISTVNSFMDWEFIPGLSFGFIASLIVGVCLMLVFLKLFAGG